MSDSCQEEWQELTREYEQLEADHREYVKKVQEVKAVQKKVMGAIAHQRYRVKQVSDEIKMTEKNPETDGEARAMLRQLKEQINERKNAFRDMEDVLPHENGLYLKIILGSVNVSLLSKIDKFKYKEDYERFKLILSIIIFVFAIFLLFIEYRVTDALFQFLLVWYYCTLTIREHILKVNGSRIKGWWITHHFISTFCSGILLLWPHGYTYMQFRMQFICFSVYLSFVQFIQFYYQWGMLYRLRCLGERRHMHLTVEGFQSWMWKGLSFVLPFLIVAYIFQLHNAHTLYMLSQHEKCTEWQVFILACIFFVLFLGNTWTTLQVLKAKFFSGVVANMEMYLRNKYASNSNKAEQPNSPTKAEEPKSS